MDPGITQEEMVFSQESGKMSLSGQVPTVRVNYMEDAHLVDEFHFFT